MAAIDVFQTAATTFLAAAATYAADASAVAEVVQGGRKFYFDPANDLFLGSGRNGASLDNAVTVFRGEVKTYAASNPSKDFHELTDYNLRIGGGDLVALDHD